MNHYQVIVGNIGTVHQGNTYNSAIKVFGEYKRQSVEGYGHAAGEDVTLIRDDEIIAEHAVFDDYFECEGEFA